MENNQFFILNTDVQGLWLQVSSFGGLRFYDRDKWICDGMCGLDLVRFLQHRMEERGDERPDGSDQDG